MELSDWCPEKGFRDLTKDSLNSHSNILDKTLTFTKGISKRSFIQSEDPTSVYPKIIPWPIGNDILHCHVCSTVAIPLEIY